MARLRLEFVHEYRDRHGKPRRYFRRRGSKRIPLPGLPGSTEFMEAYQAALAGVSAPNAIGASRTKPGTMNAAIVGYYQSVAFRELASGTQRKYRHVLEHMRNEVGERQIAGLEQSLIVKRLSPLKPAASRNWLKVIRALLDFAVAEGFRTNNPARDIRPRKYKEQSHHAWTAEEIAQFEAYYPIGSAPRLAFALLLYTMQRRGDVIRMGPQHIRDGEIYIKQQKTGAELVLPIRPELQAVIDATPCRHLTFLTADSGRPFTGDYFSRQFREWCDAAGLPGSCNAHGLRHTGAYRLANDRATAHQVMAWGGWKSLQQVQRYTKAADQRHNARQAVGLDREQPVANLTSKSG